MAFAAIHIRDFIVQAVIRCELALRHQPVAIIDGKPPLWLVVAENDAARQLGIDLGMAKSQAAQFPGVQLRHRSPAQEQIAHAALLDVGWSISPRVEDTAADTIVVDLAGLNSLFASQGNIADELAQRATHLGFEARIAIAEHVEVAVLAARGFSGITLIAAGEESRRLGSLPVSALLPSLEILETFDRWGVHTCAQLAALPLLQLSERLGQYGVRLHELARGAHLRSLVQAEAHASFFEEMELDDAVEDLESLSFVLGRLLDQLCARLMARSLAARAIGLEFTLEAIFEKNIQRQNDHRQKKISPTYRKVLALPVPLRDSK